jgi:hypothetical protein
MTKTPAPSNAAFKVQCEKILKKLPTVKPWWSLNQLTAHDAVTV